MNNTLTIFKRELAGYFETPVAYVFMVVFLLLSGLFMFYLGGFLEIGQANLVSFFGWHVWLYMFLIPAVSMRLWAEERYSGTIEMLMTLPIKPREAVLGKYLAAWCFVGISLLFTAPVWLTVNYLGEPDNGVILLSYLVSLIMAGAFLALGSCISAITKNQVVAFIISIAACFLFSVSGFDIVLDFFSGLGLSQDVLNTISSFSFVINFDDVLKGVFSLNSFLFFVSFITFWLYVNVVVVGGRF